MNEIGTANEGGSARTAGRIEWNRGAVRVGPVVLGILMMAAGAARADFAAPRLPLAAIDRWIHDHMMNEMVRLLGREAHRGAAVEIEGEIGVRIPLPEAPVLSAAFKAKPRVTLEWSPRGYIQLHLVGEGRVGAAITAGTAIGEGGVTGRLGVVFRARPENPGETTRLMYVLLFGLDVDREMQVERLLNMIPGDAFHGVTGLLGPVLGGMVDGLRDAPPLSKLLYRVKLEGGEDRGGQGQARGRVHARPGGSRAAARDR
jgi:hypothetical protein